MSRLVYDRHADWPMVDKFVWQVHLRQDVLDDAMVELRGLPHEVLRRIIEQPLKKKVRGRDQKLYRLRVSANWVAPDSRDFVITLRLKRGWFGKPLTDSFAVRAQGTNGASSVDES